MTSGGALGYGNIYKLTLDGALTNLYSFTGGTDGSSPQGTLVQGSDGALYGTTEHNRISIFDFYGTIFRVTTNGALGTLYALNNGDGHYPAAGLIQGSDGNFYGTTFNGGASDNGTVFRVAPNGKYSTLVEFDGFDDGAHPTAALVEGLDGSFYGTTASGGLGGQGTIFRLSATAAPQITAQPVNQTALLGTDVSFSVAAFGKAPLSYQWLENGTNLLVDGPNLSGAQSRILTLRGVSGTNTGAYSITVSNSIDSITSASALLTVTSPPQFIAVSQHGQAITLTWSAVPGRSYWLQYKGDLIAASWTDLAPAVLATGPTAKATDTNGAPQRFYRIRLVR